MIRVLRSGAPGLSESGIFPGTTCNPSSTAAFWGGRFVTDAAATLPFFCRLWRVVTTEELTFPFLPTAILGTTAVSDAVLKHAHGHHQQTPRRRNPG